VILRLAILVGLQIPEFDGQTDGRTHDDNIYHTSTASRSKKEKNVKSKMLHRTISITGPSNVKPRFTISNDLSSSSSAFISDRSP